MIEQIAPRSAPELTDDDILELYAGAPIPPSGPPPVPSNGRIRVNFVTSLDGSATVDGRSGSLGGPADLRVFDLLRRLADVVLVGAGTVRTEGYGPMRLHDADVVWRRNHGLPDHPVFAIVSGALALDPTSPIFTEAPVRPLILTVANAPDGPRAALDAVADVIDCGDTTIDPAQVRAAVVQRGLPRIHCEGGPSLLGALIAADAVDELCLSLSPTLEGGAGPRIAAGRSAPRTLRLAHVLRADDLLLTRHVR
ncbi:pyrimidine reductase family protein [Curtobacterium ammoniigenes]|uniref:pyrimidine reductase family protein n=1 Tax=Curtobacterium ammoniigenes TaxID=395387 RepID=UPI000B0884FE|nr:pyrimidine reductase family protein [Curtobacterium ammoniigenes]